MVNTYPVDFTTEVGRVRKYIPDLTLLPDPSNPTAPASFMWNDDEIQSFVDDEDGNIKRAAAYILIATANNENLILKKLTTEDLATDGPAVSNAMLKTAERLLAETAASASEVEDFISVDYVPAPPRYDWR